MGLQVWLSLTSAWGTVSLEDQESSPPRKLGNQRWLSPKWCTGKPWVCKDRVSASWWQELHRHGSGGWLTFFGWGLWLAADQWGSGWCRPRSAQGSCPQRGSSLRPKQGLGQRLCCSRTQEQHTGTFPLWASCRTTSATPRLAWASACSWQGHWRWGMYHRHTVAGQECG